MAEKLTPKQEKYIHERLKGKTQREAYKAAYDVKRMSNRAVDTEACELEANPKVALRMRELQERAASKAVASAQEILEELTKIAMGTEAYPDYNIAGEKVEKLPNMSSRLKAIELLGKYHKLFTEKIEEKSDTTVRVVIGKNKEFAE